MLKRSILVGCGAFLAAACASSPATGPTGGNTATAHISLINALSGSGAHVTLDQSAVTLPAAGGSASLATTAGAHQIAVVSASGRASAPISFSIDADSTRTVVVSGTPDTAVASIAIDSNIVNPSQPVPTTGHILMVNSAPGVGPFDVTVTRAAVDSTLRFSGFSFGVGTPQSTSPLQYSFPFQPDTYTFDVTNPGATNALASAQVTLATGDQWVLVLTTDGNGNLQLTATKE